MENNTFIYGFSFLKRWPSWSKGMFWSLLAFIATGSIAAGMYAMYGHDWMYPYTTTSSLSLLDFPIDEFDLGPFSFKVLGDTYTITELFTAQGYNPDHLLAYAMVACLGLLLVLAFPFVSMLQSKYFYPGVTILIACLGLLKFDSLSLFGVDSPIVTGLVVLLFAGPSYYFHHFDHHLSFQKKLAVFAGIVSLVALVIAFFSNLPQPFLYLGTVGSVPFYVLTLFFVFITSIQIVLVLFSLVVTNTAASSGRNAINLLIFVLIYVVNLALLWAEYKGFLAFEVYLVHPTILLFIGGIAGIWGLQRAGTLKEQVPLHPYGLLVYLTLFLVALFFVGYGYATDDDNQLLVLEKAIIFIHLGYGAFFALYIFSNFFDLMDKGPKLTEVVFKSRRMPVLVLHGFALATVGGSLLNESFSSFEEVQASYFAKVGDYNYAIKRPKLAMQAYLRSKFFENLPHKTNYALAEIAHQAGDQGKEMNYLEMISYGSPSPQAILRLSQIKMDRSDFWGSLYKLQDGLKAYPGNPRIANNLAKLFEQTGQTDSVLAYYNKALASKETEDIVASNLLGYAVTAGIFKDSAQLAEKDLPAYRPYAINVMAFNNWLQRSHYQDLNMEWLPDSILDANDLAYFFNYAVNNADEDSSLIPKINAYLAADTNFYMAEELLFLKAITYYYNGYVIRAMHILNNFWLNRNPAAYRYGNALALWMLKQENYQQAAALFERLNRSDDYKAMTYLAYSLTEAGYFQEALDLWETLSESPNPSIAIAAANMGAVLTAPGPTSFSENNQEYTYLFIRFRKDQVPYDSLWTAYQAISDDYFKDLATVELINLAAQHGEFKVGKDLYLEQSSKELSDSQRQLNLAYLRLLERADDFETLEESMKSLTLPEESNDSVFFMASLAEVRRDSANAEKLYWDVMADLPFQFYYVKKAVDFLNATGQTQKVYDRLVDIVQLTPYDVDFKKLYVLQCALSGNSYFANSELDWLEGKLSPTEYRELQERYNAILDNFYATVY